MVIDGRWTAKDIVEAFEDGRMQKLWPNIYEAICILINKATK